MAMFVEAYYRPKGVIIVKEWEFGLSRRPQGPQKVVGTMEIGFGCEFFARMIAVQQPSAPRPEVRGGSGDAGNRSRVIVVS